LPRFSVRPISHKLTDSTGILPLKNPMGLLWHLFKRTRYTSINTQPADTVDEKRRGSIKLGFSHKSLGRETAV
jgi:hypothetical protein